VQPPVNILKYYGGGLVGNHFYMLCNKKGDTDEQMTKVVCNLKEGEGK